MHGNSLGENWEKEEGKLTDKEVALRTTQVFLLVILEARGVDPLLDCKGFQTPVYHEGLISNTPAFERIPEDVTTSLCHTDTHRSVPQLKNFPGLTNITWKERGGL